MTSSWTSPTSVSAIYLILALVMSFSIICFGREDDFRPYSDLWDDMLYKLGRLNDSGPRLRRMANWEDIYRLVRSPGLMESYERRGYDFLQDERKALKKFGCTFENKDYLVRTDSVFNAKYGEKVLPMEFNSSEEFNEMLGKIKTIYTQTLGELVYNNAPGFFDFYDAYKSNFTGDFDAFYRAYIPKYLPGQVCSSMAVTLLDNLIKEIPDMEDHCHLITSQPVVDDKLLEMVNVDKHIHLRTYLEGEWETKHQSIEPPKFKFSHGHVAALLRIMLPGKRLGFVLMDLGFGLSNPVVLMVDEKIPNQEKSWGSTRLLDGEDYRFWISNKDYVLAFTFYRKGEREGYIHEKHLFYIEKPYCSFLMTTNKANVYRPHRMINRKNKTGTDIALLTFIVNDPNPRFRLKQFDPTISGVTKYNEDIDFGTRDQMNPTTKTAFNKVIAELNVLKIEDILTKAEEIAKDSDFLGHIAKLSTDIFQYKTDPEGKQRKRKELAKKTEPRIRRPNSHFRNIIAKLSKEEEHYKSDPEGKQRKLKELAKKTEPRMSSPIEFTEKEGRNIKKNSHFLNREREELERIRSIEARKFAKSEEKEPYQNKAETNTPKY